MTTRNDRDGGEDPELRSFGRKRGRKLSARQQTLLRELLPRLAIELDQPCARDRLVPAGGELWLEIGFGGSEHLVWQAEHNPHVGFIGCEPFEEGIVKALTAIEEKRLANVHLHAGDGRDVLRWLPEGSLDRAFILFPDPWPKRKHVKRRLVSAATLTLLARAMRPGSQLRVATDIADYARTMMIAFQAVPAFAWRATCAGDWRARPPDWPPTRYEQKAALAGRRRYYLSFERVGRQDCPPRQSP